MIVVPPPNRPFLIMNPRSGGGKVGRFGLVERAEELGARVILLDPSAPADVAVLARQAVADGADLLGVAGGDGTQALVAAVAAEHDLPFLVVCLKHPQPLRHGFGPGPRRPFPLPRRADRRRGTPGRPRRRRGPGLRQHRVLRGIRRRRSTARVPRRQGGHGADPHAGPAARRRRATARRTGRRHRALLPAGTAGQQQPVRLTRRSLARRLPSPGWTTANWVCSGSGWRTRRRPPTWPCGARSPRG